MTCPRLLLTLLMTSTVLLVAGCSGQSRSAPWEADGEALLDRRGQHVSLLETSAPVRSDAWYADRLDRGPGAYAGYSSPKVTYSEVYTYDRLSSHYGNVVDHYRRARRSVTITDAIR